jgi:thiamine-phosphate pyrophosphorylase
MSATPAIIAITDSSRATLERWLEALESLLVLAAPDRVMVMLRDRQLSVGERMSFGHHLRALTRRHGQRFSVNDRLDLAVLLDADAVHLSESSVAASDVRAFAREQGRSFWISRATHQPDEVATLDADAVLLAPIAEPRKGRPPLGVEGLARARVARASRSSEIGRCSVYALGGVSAANATAWTRAGADGVALIGALLEPEAPRALLDALAARRSMR